MKSMHIISIVRWLAILVLATNSHTSIGKDIIKVAASDFPPYTIISGDTITGIDIILANKITQKLNLKIQYVQCPWKRCLKLMEHGQIDLLTGVYKRPERERYLLFIKPHYIEATDSFYIATDNPLQITQYEDLKPISIGIERGSRVFEPFDSDSSLNKHEVKKLTQAITMTLLGRLDTFVGATIPTNYLLLKKNHHGKFKQAKFVITGSDTYAFITISKNSEYSSRVDEFTQILKTIKLEGEVNSTFKLFKVGGDIPLYPLE